ncbi:hypothetical protein [Thermomonospora umbrina]|uniref:Uncharacterized protein n=1 Tax=Thermomonospora umbrina TaxID=111806 RepID=A0A3D9SV97_9ACTN|nr:hypothetical protein [Thermomonospora umbrina]REE96925.1 hypothetical protein DFJ69_2378 [Thermomonospora umbrina]
MASDKHSDLRAFMEQMRQSGSPPPGKRMVLNPQTGKFEIQSTDEQLGDQVPQIDVEDMRAFARG